jgi:hypothetical protein
MKTKTKLAWKNKSSKEKTPKIEVGQFYEGTEKYLSPYCWASFLLFDTVLSQLENKVSPCSKNFDHF